MGYITRDTLRQGIPRLRSLDAPLPKGGTLHERVADPRVRRPDDDAEAPNTVDAALEVLAAVLEASIGEAVSPKLIPPHLSNRISHSITGERTRQLLQLLYQNGGDQALGYIFGLVDGRKVPLLELLEPARHLWPSGAAQQNARTLLDRSQATLRANFPITLATYDEKLFLGYLFRFGSKEGWRKGTVDRLAAWREELAWQAPEQADALSELTKPALGKAIIMAHNFRQLTKGIGAVPLFTAAYTTLRYVGLFSRHGIEAADMLH